MITPKSQFLANNQDSMIKNESFENQDITSNNLNISNDMKSDKQLKKSPIKSSNFQNPKDSNQSSDGKRVNSIENLVSNKDKEEEKVSKPEEKLLEKSPTLEKSPLNNNIPKPFMNPPGARIPLNVMKKPQIVRGPNPFVTNNNVIKKEENNEISNKGNQV